MCTLSILRRPIQAFATSAWKLRIVCNRDEKKDRPVAHPPAIRQCGELGATMPLDPQSGGTWIGVNEMGLFGCLLNRQSIGKRPTHPISRGTLVPRILSQPTLDQAMAVLETLELSHYDGFRLVMVQGETLVQFENHGEFRQVRRESIGFEPRLFTSCGLGDSIAWMKREPLFRQMVRRIDAPSQDRFHRHSWPREPEWSVCMRRPDALTVSCTVLEIGESNVRWIYSAGPPDEESPHQALTWPLGQEVMA